MQQFELLNQLIKGNHFEHYYQSIFNLTDDSIIGGELLLRAEHGSPDLIFNEAIKYNRLYELDTRSIHKALKCSHSLHRSFVKEDFMLFINVFPSTIINPTFPTFLNSIVTELNISCQQIIFEINETESIDPLLLLKKIHLLKDYGFLIALDDVGKGWPSIRSIIEIEPNYIKLDQFFAVNLDMCNKKQDFIKAVLWYCNENNINVILEGIENVEVLNAAKDIGVHMGQGFYLGKPQKID